MHGADPRHAHSTVDCGAILLCKLTLPLCGPAVSPPQGSAAVQYTGTRLPSNTSQLLGFAPLLPTQIPAAASWYQAVLYPLTGPTTAPLTSGQVIALHAGYGNWPPHRDLPGNVPNLFSVLTVDEVVGPLGPMTLLNDPVEAPRVVSQRAVTVSGQPAMLYHLTFANVPDGQPAVVEVIWGAGTISLRVLSLLDAAPGWIRESVDVVEPWLNPGGLHDPASADPQIVQIADSVAPFTGCED
jgi:hypothetical protein